VIFASSRFVTAFDQASGAVRWQTQLIRSVVNASALVVEEPGLPGRVFITSYDGFGSAGALYCINGDPFDQVNNPYLPGQIVWSAPIGGSSGNTPAYLARQAGGVGLVYVTTIGDGESEVGSVLGFPAAATSAPTPAMSFMNVIEQGFFGGVSVVPPAAPGQHPSLLCASYAFSGGVLAANLVKVDGANGQLQWSIPCNRSGSIPVPLPGGRILLTGGVVGAFGTVPSIELFQDHGMSAEMVWDSALATWIDANGNGTIDDGEYVAVGGWTQQPVASTFGGGAMAAVGLIPASTFSASHDLWTLDLSRTPNDPAFYSQHVMGAGGSPAFAGANLYSVGTSGLVSYGPPPAALDLSADSRIGSDDLYLWEEGVGNRDIDGDGLVTQSDRGLLMSALRSAQRAAMTGGRP
jgi:outer membrane protein assembly factor BamB